MLNFMNGPWMIPLNHKIEEVKILMDRKIHQTLLDHQLKTFAATESYYHNKYISCDGSVSTLSTLIRILWF